MFLKKKPPKRWNNMQYDVKKGLTRNKVSINIARVLFGKLLLKVWNIKTE